MHVCTGPKLWVMGKDNSIYVLNIKVKINKYIMYRRNPMPAEGIARPRADNRIEPYYR